MIALRQDVIMSQTERDRPSVLRAARERTRAEITRETLDAARRHLAIDAASGLSLRATHRLVTGLVERELRREDLPSATFGNLRSQELTLAKTEDRSVLGCMNDMAFL
jgi:hypothetical protein